MLYHEEGDWCSAWNRRAQTHKRHPELSVEHAIFLTHSLNLCLPLRFLNVSCFLVWDLRTQLTSPPIGLPSWLFETLIRLIQIVSLGRFSPCSFFLKPDSIWSFAKQVPTSVPKTKLFTHKFNTHFWNILYTLAHFIQPAFIYLLRN